MHDKIKRYFKNERYYRLFIILQIFSIIVLVIYDMLVWQWSIPMFFNSLGETSPYYIIGNILVFSTIILPLFISKSIDWILSSRK